MKKTRRKSQAIIDKAKLEVKGFRPMYAKLEQKVKLSGLSDSTLTNYGRCLARISVHFNCPAHVLEEEQIMDTYNSYSQVNNHRRVISNTRCTV